MILSNVEKQLASAALQVGKTAAKDIGMKAVDEGKTVIAKYVDTSTINLTKLIHGSGVNHPNASNRLQLKTS